jgi:NAD(P)-dependent dehydrogenase (short-subunit alcohol dehydrogenase family)
MSKNIIVTGASRGIGRAIAEALIKDGFNVCITSIKEDEAKKAVEEMSVFGSVEYRIIDLRDRGEIKKFTSSWSKDLYGLVNNAGIWREERIDEEDKNIWDDIINLDLNGVYFLTKGLAPKITSPGRIVNISSQLGLGGRAGFGAYAAAKHGVIGLTRCWAQELGPKNITVNAVCPGWVKTQSNIDEIHEFAANENKTFEQKFSEIAATTIMNRFIEPSEVANLVSFLMSEKGSGVNGQAYEIK